MSMQLKLIPIYMEDVNLINVYERDYDNYQTLKINEIKLVNDNNLKELFNDKNQEQFGEETIIKTTMKNKEFLIKSIEKYSQRFQDQDQLIDFMDKGSLEISQTRKGTYNLIFRGYFQQEEINYINDYIQKEYNLQVQDTVYKKIIEKIKQENYDVLTEDLDEEDSIIMTVKVY